MPFWSLSLYFYHSPIFLNSKFWLKLTLFFSFILVGRFFSLFLERLKLPFKKVIFLFGFLFLIGIFIQLFNHLKILSPISTTFVLLVLLYIILIFAISLKKYLVASSSQETHLIYSLIGLEIFVVGNTFFYLFLPLIINLKSHLWTAPGFGILSGIGLIFGYYLITEIQKRKEAEKLAKEWERLHQAKDEFILSLQHHLRTPLVPVKLYLDSILKGFYGKVENPLIKEKLFQIKKSLDIIYNLVESLVDVQQIKLGKNILNLESCKIENLIESVIEELSLFAKEKALFLRFEKPKNPLPELSLDKKKIREAIWNLVYNGIRYTERGGVSVKAKIEGSKLIIEVKDTGIGMEKEEIENFLKGKLFERGERGKKIHKGGIGVGLAISIEFIKAHQGKIWAESLGKDKGTTFYIELPIKK